MAFTNGQCFPSYYTSNGSDFCLSRVPKYYHSLSSLEEKHVLTHHLGFLMKKGRFKEAYGSLCALRGSQIQAAKEMIELDAQIQTAEAKLFSRFTDDEEALSRGGPHTSTEQGRSAYGDQSSIHSINSIEHSDFEVDDSDDDDEEPMKLRQHVARKLTHVFWRGKLRDEDPTTFEAQFKLTNYWSRITQLIKVPRTRRASEFLSPYWHFRLSQCSRSCCFRGHDITAAMCNQHPRTYH